LSAGCTAAGLPSTLTTGATHRAESAAATAGHSKLDLVSSRRHRATVRSLHGLVRSRPYVKRDNIAFDFAAQEFGIHWRSGTGIPPPRNRSGDFVSNMVQDQNRWSAATASCTRCGLDGPPSREIDGKRRLRRERQQKNS
jgi:hypothetical protein